VTSARRASAPRREHLLPAPPPDPVAQATLSLTVGELLVYASHGIGRIESTQPADGPLPGRIVLVFEREMRVTLPLPRARRALRRLSSEPELEEVQRTLRADPPPPVEPWSRRHRLAQEKLAAGRVVGLAEIVRDSVRKERRLAAEANGRSTPPSEQELYRRARQLLAAEIAASRGLETDTAEAWILQQVSGGDA
jgi:RNA polymerase-interacting CarD/CdnL/TRCF family regulator